MAARKLQTEIDRTLKKVSEGVEQFEEQYQKILQTTNPAHKEKIESELKTQIKKLQRLRDQIKTWLASNDIKDKKALVDNRKLIETQMERFKACEKEMKTKAFSKEGLSAGTRIDPKEQAKLETVGFIQNQVDELSRQVETTEAEVEQLQGGAKKSKKGAASNAERIDLLETQNERRNWHISRLELINRLIDNGNLDADRVQSLKEDISYFVESNTEEDFEEDEGIYDELNLDDEEEAFGMANDDLQSSHDSMSLADTSDIAPPPPTTRTPAKKETKPAAKEDTENDKSPTTAKSKSTIPAPARKPTLDGTAQRPTGLTGPGSRTTSGTVGAAASKDTAPSAPAPRAVPTVLPPIRYSAAAASAVHAQASPQAASTTPAATAAPAVSSPTSVVSPPTTQPLAISKAANASPEVQKAALPTPTASVGMSSEASPSPAPSQASGPTSSTVPQTSVSSGSPKASAATDAARVLSPPQQAASIAPLQALEVNPQAQQQRAPSQSAEDKTGIPMSDEATQPLASPNSQAPTLPQAGIIGQGSGTSAEPRLPSSLADLVTSFESAKQKSLRRDNDLGAIHKILEAGYPNIPQPADAEKPKYYIPRNPYPTPSYYPQQPSPHLANPSLFAKFDVDTLFYIFYYCQGTYVQYLAAQELKKQSWRFHKQYLTWFQRANEPQTITDEYEQGVYLYFDFEGSWAQRRKENFSFFYRHLEE